MDTSGNDNPAPPAPPVPVLSYCDPRQARPPSTAPRIVGGVILLIAFLTCCAIAAYLFIFSVLMPRRSQSPREIILACCLSAFCLACCIALATLGRKLWDEPAAEAPEDKEQHEP